MPRHESPAPYFNPSLREELMTAKVFIIPPRANESLLGWIEASGRFKIEEPVESLYEVAAEGELDEILLDAADEPEEEEEGDWDMN